MAWGLARIRQLSAHEVGHTLGIGHNYYDSEAGRISVMDYPHPLVTMKPDNTFDYSKVYDVGIGVGQGGDHFRLSGLPRWHRRSEGLARSSMKATRRIQYLTNQDLGAHARVDQWSNGTNAVAELKRMLDMRRVALSRFGEQAIKRDEPMASPRRCWSRSTPPSASGRSNRVDRWRALLHLRDARRWPRACPVRSRGRAARRRPGADRDDQPSELALPADLLKKIPHGRRGTDGRELFLAIRVRCSTRSRPR